ncbi:hypothetical protein A8139_00230 [Marinomonas primoryensis]|jgi:hypothetical protein|uniref:Uncharacterized protein n=1 Tax=Marinomonas primoryensis TaxID=178399 RepID=A0A2Z4PLY1_9GAMM|nr:hypothetical protein [Marinomonas primoryensis]AWX98587.1 hypothetical protein A8139_00230 [Marinomonas primoryensis]
MIWVQFIVVHSLPFVGFFGLWQSIYFFYVFFFGARSNLVDGYFSYKPDIFEKSNMYDYVWIYWRNCLRYLFGIERPPMPWYAKVNTVFCALGIILSLWGCLLAFLDDYLHVIDLDEWMTILRTHGMF